MKKAFSLVVLALMSVLALHIFPANAKVYEETKKMAVQASVLRPLTNDEIAAFPNKSFSEKWQFLAAYYTENKIRNATDEAVLNEMVKLSPQLALLIIKSTQNLSQNWDSIKDVYANVVSEFNLIIKKEYPDHPEYLIDPNDLSTISNLRHVVDVKFISPDLLTSMTDQSSFSEYQETPFGYYRLMSCARKAGQSDILLAAEIGLKEGYSILYQKEGLPKSQILADFSDSENIKKLTLWYPAPKLVTLNDGNATVYKEKVVFPFTATIEDSESEAFLNASLSFDVCKDGTCAPATTPVAKRNFEKTTEYETKICYELQSIKRTVPEFDTTSGLNISKISLKKTEQGISLFALAETPLLAAKTPALIISNTVGLHFEKPFSHVKDGQVLYRSQLLNPENLTFPLSLTLSLEQQGHSFEKNVVLNDFQNSVRLFDLTFFDYLNAFFLGLKLLCFTPFLVAFFLLFYKSVFSDEKSGYEQAFVGGLGIGFLFLFAVFIASAKMFPTAFLTGKQFSSPYLNAVFSCLFASTPFWLYAIICRPASENRFGVSNGNKNSFFIGFITMLICGLFVSVSPQIPLFFALQNLFEKEFYTGMVVCIAGFVTPFAFLLYGLRYLHRTNIRLSNVGKALFCSPFLYQSILLGLVIWTETSVDVFFLWAVLMSSAFALMLYVPISSIKKIIIAVILILSFLLFIPQSPTRVSNAVPYTPQAVAEIVDKGKVAYVNVTTPGCLSCVYNRFIYNMYASRSKKVKNTSLLEADINNASVSTFLKDAEHFSLPTNILYGPKAPQGIILPNILSIEELIFGVQKMISDL